MTKDIENNTDLKKVQRSILLMRFGFIMAFMALIGVNIFLFLSQNENANNLQRTLNTSRQFTALSEQFETVITETEAANATLNNDPYSFLYGNLQNSEKAFKAKISFIYQRSKQILRTRAILKDINKLDNLWMTTPQDLKQKMLKRKVIENIDDPFNDFKTLFPIFEITNTNDSGKLLSINNRIIREYNRDVRSRNQIAHIILKEYLAELVEEQSKGHEKFLFGLVITLIASALFILLPFDIMMQRIFRRLAHKTQETNIALHNAQAADRAKSEFLATMSHEIRTPMNGVLGMAELLSRTELDHRQQTFADIIIKSGTALLSIINDILDFSKIEAAQLTLDPSPFDMVESIEDIGSLMSAKAAEKDIELILRIKPDIPESLIGDQGRIRQVITNLVSNAIKFTEVGHVLVDVSWQHINHKNGNETARLKFKVEDTGIGIPEDKLESVFEKFHQIDGSATRKHEGTGLGLAISSRLVELMGGEIKAKSAFGEGSCFFFEIELPIDSSFKALSTNQEQRAEHAKILVVDDNSVNRTILIEHCEAWGHECVAVESAELALQFIKHAAIMHNFKIDLIISDFHMPILNGADLVRMLRQGDQKIANIPIMILSSVDQADQLIELRDLGVDAYLPKPARSKQLRQTVESILNRRTQASDKAQTMRQPTLPEDEKKQSVSINTQQQGNKPDNNAGISNMQGYETELDILIAEDNPVNQIVFSEALKMTNMSFKIANDGVEAIAMWQNEHPKMIIMDISMPRMNGYQATERIREIEKNKGLERTPIVAVTAHALKGDREKCLEAGMDDYMTKPISPDMLKTKTSKWLNNHNTQKAVRS